MTRILFVEDDANLGLLLKENLTNKGFDTVWCKDGSEAFDRFRTDSFNLCLLDVMLPVNDGFTLARKIRSLNADIPTIFLTARGMHEDKVKGFEFGCDDYVTKPFNTQELCLRINAVLKRLQPVNGSGQKAFQLGLFEFDYTKMVLTGGAESKKINSKESELLYMLIASKNEFVPR